MMMLALSLFGVLLEILGQEIGYYLLRNYENYPKFVSIHFQNAEVPFYIWYDDYPEHASTEYQGRVHKVSPQSHYGLASLVLSGVKDTDRGWYNCKVLFLNREPHDAVVSEKVTPRHDEFVYV